MISSTASAASRLLGRSKKAAVILPLAALSAVSITALVSGCGGGKENNSVFTPSASSGSTLFFARSAANRSIGATGGTVATQSGGVALNIPAGALSETVSVGIAPTDALPAPPPAGYAVLAETAYTLTAGTLNQLLTAGQLSLRYDPSAFRPRAARPCADTTDPRARGFRQAAYSFTTALRPRPSPNSVCTPCSFKPF